VWAAAAPAAEVLGRGGGGGPRGFVYAHAARPAMGRLSEAARDEALAAELWEATEECVRRAGVVQARL
jgi:hypothetical protein